MIKTSSALCIGDYIWCVYRKISHSPAYNRYLYQYTEGYCKVLAIDYTHHIVIHTDRAKITTLYDYEWIVV